MTNSAILGRWQVRRNRIGFTGRGDAVMARIAAHGAHGRTVVVDEHRGEIGGVMTQRAVGDGDRVWWTGRFCPGADAGKAAVMARRAVSIYSLVSGHGRRRCERRDVVAGIAILTRRNMVAVLDQVFRRAGG